MPSRRLPAVAGIFYPAQANLLYDTISQLLAENQRQLACAPKALIVPHAGYQYSAAVAACAYSTLQPFAHTYQRVVLAGPAHRVAFSGLCVPATGIFSTPLGEIPLQAPAALTAQTTLSDLPHQLEHSLEVQLPFLQHILPEFTLTPLLAGHTTASAMAEALEQLWGDSGTLIVISSDLSHYLSYDHARQKDRATLQQILRGDADLDGDQACGAIPIAGLLQCIRQHQLTGHLLDYRNSGDTAGDRQRVVGYAALAYCEEHHDTIH
ncbi:AmmeMemoRadiSam system protein B [Chitinilyticum piscinae]|uniref:MEMO1 family protein INR99_09740 n=1 Tax=Chitinilyticum piscinae TaxID=2866724 RepID=A0A8J7G0C2_9NEIS|nr:AmmeMemoRadiSam system protein B [Chitinilyticum piscinae]MBE9609635.1 AmmeMemoRadiSam system protein B [Chitinilyticum piscinae]